MYKNLEFEAYLRFNTKEKQKTGTLHNQLIPLEHITLGTLDVWINLVKNELHSHLHHLVVILHFKEDLQLIDDLRCIFSTFLHRKIGLRGRRHQLVPVIDIL